MAKKKTKRTPKLKPIQYALGDLYMIDGEVHRVAFINQGCAYLSPERDEPGKFRFVGCADRKMDRFGRLPNLEFPLAVVRDECAKITNVSEEPAEAWMNNTGAPC